MLCCAQDHTGICDLDGGPLGRHDRWCGPPSASNQSSELITSTSTTPDPLPSSSLTRLKTPLIWQVELGRVAAKQVLRLAYGHQAQGGPAPWDLSHLNPNPNPNLNPAGDLLTRVHDSAVGAGGGLPPERLGLL